jgi:hypothetical protein
MRLLGYYGMIPLLIGMFMLRLPLTKNVTEIF